MANVPVAWTSVRTRGVGGAVDEAVRHAGRDDDRFPGPRLHRRLAHRVAAPPRVDDEVRFVVVAVEGGALAGWGFAQDRREVGQAEAAPLRRVAPRQQLGGSAIATTTGVMGHLQTARRSGRPFRTRHGLGGGS